MVNSFQFASTPNIVFGSGKLRFLPEYLNRYNPNVLVITGAKSFQQSVHWDQMSSLMEKYSILWEHHMIDKEPTPSMIDECVKNYKERKIESVVAIGGGSVIDAGKAVSAMLKHEGSVKDYLEGVGVKQPTGDKVPFIAVPTTSGTGSEATKNAVISEIGKSGFKKSLRHDRFVPDIALIDPELTLNCPRIITAQSGMDAFTQLLESYLSTNATPMTDALALDALQIVKEALPTVINEPENLIAREKMSYAALISGITLANAGLGVVHGFASSLGGLFDIPHGMLCGTLMGVANRLTVEVLTSTNDNKIALAKYAKVGKLFSDQEGKSDDYYVWSLIDLIERWTEEFSLKRLSDYGVREKDFPKIVKETSNKYNPAVLNDEDLTEILQQRF